MIWAVLLSAALDGLALAMLYAIRGTLPGILLCVLIGACCGVVGGILTRDA